MTDLIRHTGIPVIVTPSDHGYLADWSAIRYFANVEGGVVFGKTREEALRAACAAIDAALFLIVATGC